VPVAFKLSNKSNARILSVIAEFEDINLNILSTVRINNINAGQKINFEAASDIIRSTSRITLFVENPGRTFFVFTLDSFNQQVKGQTIKVLTIFPNVTLKIGTRRII
jgi:hypothetical protein